MKRSRSPQVEASCLSASVARTDGNASTTIRSTSASAAGGRGRAPASFGPPWRGLARPGRDDPDAGLWGPQGERERRQRHVERVRDRAEPLDHHPPALELPAFEPVDLASVIGGGELRGCRILPAQESRGQGPVGQERDPTLPAQRQLPLLHIPVEQVVGPLIGGHGRYFQGLRELSGAGVAEADRQRLAFFLQRVELLEAPLPAVERFVQLYQVHIVGRQPSQGCFERAAGGRAPADPPPPPAATPPPPGDRSLAPIKFCETTQVRRATRL